MTPVRQLGLERELRRDAAENLDRILDAARRSFDEDGFDVGMEKIAHRAGVGVGTIYRRFPTKDLLIEAIVNEVLVAIRDAAIVAVAEESPSQALREYLFSVGQLLYDHAGCLPRLWSIDDDAILEEIESMCRTMLARSQRDGVMRDDVVYEDIVTIFWSLQGVIERTATITPNAWRRHLELVLPSLSNPLVELETAPISVQQARRARRVMIIEGRTGIR